MTKKLSDKQFLNYIEKKVRKTIRLYNLFSKRDIIGVAVSGGKDSITCLYILKKLGYNVEAITIDASIGNYTKINTENMQEVCKKHKIKLHTVSFRKDFGRSLCYLRGVLKSKGYDYSSCMLCGILKRYLLNKYSKKLKFDYLATGHNLDDEAQAFLMNVFRNDFMLGSRQGPISRKGGKSFVRRVKPLFFISEAEVIRYSKLMKFPVNYEICPCSAGAHRREYKNMLDDWEKKNPGVKYSIIRFQETMKENLKKSTYHETQVNACKYCGEPASKTVCKTCEIFKKLSI